jgi:spore coat protein CotH
LLIGEIIGKRMILFKIHNTSLVDIILDDEGCDIISYYIQVDIKNNDHTHLIVGNLLTEVENDEEFAHHVMLYCDEDNSASCLATPELCFIVDNEKSAQVFYNHLGGQKLIQHFEDLPKSNPIVLQKYADLQDSFNEHRSVEHVNIIYHQSI